MSSIIEQELQNLPSQFKLKDDGNNTNLSKVLTALLTPFDQFNDNLTEEQNTLLDIEKSTGNQLDVIGKLIDLSREGFTDEEYRTFLKLKTKLNNADGSADFTMFAVGNALDTNQYFYTEGNVAEVILHLNLKQALSQRQLNILKKNNFSRYKIKNILHNK